MTTLKSNPIDYHCPDWCARTDHDADYVGPGSPPMHYGPTFGLIDVMGWRTEELEAVIDYDNQSMTPDVLRQLARDAAAAADWLEGHLPAGALESERGHDAEVAGLRRSLDLLLDAVDALEARVRSEQA